MERDQDHPPTFGVKNPYPHTVVLVGMMGTGKTSVGRRLAPRLGLPFSDTDDEIEKAAGMKVSAFFADYGETEFRAGEKKVIQRLLDGPPHVFAFGGGAFNDPETRALVKEKAVSVWIQTDIDEILRRVSRRDDRPLLKTGDPRETLTRLLDERKDFYADADIHIESRLGPHDLTVDAILSALADHASPSENQ